MKPATITADRPLTQADKLDALIAAAKAARIAADYDLLFASSEGVALINAAYDVFECDGLYDLAGDTAAQIGRNVDGTVRLTLAHSSEDEAERCSTVLQDTIWRLFGPGSRHTSDGREG